MAADPEAAAHEVRIRGADGSPLRGFLAAPSGASPRPALLFLHWRFGDATSFLAEARAYARAGASALTFDAPGYGARKGPRVGANDPARVRAGLPVRAARRLTRSRNARALGSPIAEQHRRVTGRRPEREISTHPGS